MTSQSNSSKERTYSAISSAILTGAVLSSYIPYVPPYMARISEVILANWVLTLVALVAIGILLSKSGVFDSLEWYQKISRSYERINGLIDQAHGFGRMFGSKNKDNKKKELSYFLNKTHQSATISYERNDRTQKLSVPFDPELVSTTRSFKVYLITMDSSDTEVRMDITQQSGIPYLCTAEDLGGLRIEVEHRSGTTKTLTPTEHLTKEFFQNF